MPLEAPKVTILADHPTLEHDNSQDRLDYEHRLATIFDIIRHKKTACPMTIAIYGEWGTGKTSAMRWLQSQLEDWSGPQWKK